MGDGTTIGRDIPVQINALNDIKQIDSGYFHGLALRTDGTVWGWGRNDEGQLGFISNDGSNNYYTVPVHISALENIKRIAVSSNSNLALKEDGTVWGWGGYNYNHSPEQIVQLNNIILIDTYVSHCLALKKDGTVWAWGSNFCGQLGDGTANDSDIPIQVPGLENVIQIEAGPAVSFAIKKDGTIWAWGANHGGQLGIGYPTYMPVPSESQVQLKSRTLMADQPKTMYIKVINNISNPPVTIHYTTEDHTAVSGIDYNTSQGELHFDTNEREKEFPITILENSKRNKDCSLILRLSEPNNQMFSNYMSLGILTISANKDITAPYFQSFDTYLPGSGWTYYSSTLDGNIQVISGKLRMDGINENAQYLNEAILEIDLSGFQNVKLSFFHRSKAFANDTLPDRFDNHYNGDGICISNDGNTWYKILDANDLKTDNIGKDFTIDLDQQIKN
ncbi:MAG: hypothetical protein OMM_11109, partial [Candidatus Magnetoglobus multicellularis str. Araruama]